MRLLAAVSLLTSHFSRLTLHKLRVKGKEVKRRHHSRFTLHPLPFHLSLFTSHLFPHPARASVARAPSELRAARTNDANALQGRLPFLRDLRACNATIIFPLRLSVSVVQSFPSCPFQNSIFRSAAQAAFRSEARNARSGAVGPDARKTSGQRPTRTFVLGGLGPRSLTKQMVRRRRRPPKGE